MNKYIYINRKLLEPVGQFDSIYKIVSIDINNDNDIYIDIKNSQLEDYYLGNTTIKVRNESIINVDGFAAKLKDNFPTKDVRLEDNFNTIAFGDKIDISKAKYKIGYTIYNSKLNYKFIISGVVQHQDGTFSYIGRINKDDDISSLGYSFSNILSDRLGNGVGDIFNCCGGAVFDSKILNSYYLNDRVGIWSENSLLKYDFLFRSDETSHGIEDVSQSVSSKDEFKLEKQNFSALAKSDSIDVVYRVTAKQLSNLVKKNIINIIQKHGALSKKSSAIAFSEILNSDIGEGLISNLIGQALHFQNLSNSNKVKRLSKEFRIAGLAMIGNDLSEMIIKSLIPVVQETVNTLPEVVTNCSSDLEVETIKNLNFL